MKATPLSLAELQAMSEIPASHIKKLVRCRINRAHQRKSRGDNASHADEAENAAVLMALAHAEITEEQACVALGVSEDDLRHSRKLLIQVGKALTHALIDNLTPVALMDRFWAKVEKSPEPDGCWNWIGSTTGSGYGEIWEKDRKIPAHWVLLDVRPGAGLQACHHCDNRRCVRPSHIFIGTLSDNMQDMIRKGRHNPEARSKGTRAMLKMRKPIQGAASPNATLSEDSALLIKATPRRYGLGAQLARHFGVSETVVSGIWLGKRWSHLQPTEDDKTRAIAFLATMQTP